MVYYKLKFKPQRKPDFICIGAEKAGTTWLWTVLTQHPKISTPHPKELRYFAYHDYGKNMPFTDLTRLVTELPDLPPGEKREILINASINEMKCRFGSKEDYLEIFSQLPRDNLAGEFSPQYALLSDRYIREMYKINKNLKLLFLIRDPIERSISSAKMKIVEKKSNLTNKNIYAIAASQPQKALSSYDVTINNYLKVFSKDNFKILFYDDIKLNPHKLLRDTCLHLRVRYEDKYFNSAHQIVFKGPKFELEIDLYKKIYSEYKYIYSRLIKLFPSIVSKWEEKYKEL